MLAVTKILIDIHKTAIKSIGENTPVILIIILFIKIIMGQKTTIAIRNAAIK
jgi:hypothetical protein